MFNNITNSTSGDPLEDLKVFMLLECSVLLSVALLFHYGKKHGYCPNGHYTCVQGNIGHMPMIFSTRDDGQITWVSDEESSPQQAVMAPLISNASAETPVADPETVPGQQVRRNYTIT